MTCSRIQVRAYKPDGSCYRWWHAIIESIEHDCIITISPVNHMVQENKESWASKFAIRAFYWTNKPYSLLEVYKPSGELVEIYVNIASPAQSTESELRFTDYELDVTLQPPGAARIVDEDEFAQAIIKYGFSPEFQQSCYQAAREALDIANGWKAKGMPVFQE